MALIAMAGPSSAAVVTSIPGGTVVPMPGVDYFGTGPQAFGPGITWSSTNAIIQGGSVFGWTGGYAFGTNGTWDGGLGPMAGLNDSFAVYGITDTMTFTFATPVQAVGGFLNYLPGGTTPTTIAVYDATNTLIESFELTFLTDGSINSGQFFGFLESAPIISSFTLTDNYIGLANLTVAVTVSSVPEPGTLAMLGLGIAGLIVARRLHARGRDASA